MNYESKIINSKKLISEGKVGKAIIELFDVAIHFGFEKEIILINNRYKQTKQAELLNLVDRTQINLEKSQVGFALINLIQEIEQKLNPNDSVIKENEKKSEFSYSSCLIVILGLIFHGIRFILIGGAFAAILLIYFSVFSKQCNFSKPFNNVIAENDESKVFLNNEVLKISDAYKFTGHDKKGKKSEMIIYFVKGFNWAKEKIAVAEDSGKEFEICDFISNTGIVNKMNSDLLKGIICFGNASFEEDLNIPIEDRLTVEEDRADKRAKKLAECVNQNVSKLTPIYKLNLGKYLFEDLVSKYQRQIIVIGIIKNEEGVINSEALVNGLILEKSRKNIEFNILSFSKVLNDSTMLLRM